MLEATYLLVTSAFLLLLQSEPVVERPGNSEMRAAFGLADSTSVEFRGHDGSELAEQAFFDLVISGRPFSMERDDARGTAVLTLFEADAKATDNEGRGLSFEVGDSLPMSDVLALPSWPADLSLDVNKPLLINFYFAQCAPCIQEIPQLNQFQLSHDDIDVLAITYDSADEAVAFSQEYSFGWPVVPEALSFIDTLGVDVYPTLLLVDSDDRLLAVRTGGGVSISGTEITEFSVDQWVQENLEPR